MRLVALVMTALVLAGCAERERAPDARQEETITLEAGAFAAPSFGAHTDVRVRATFDVTDGGPIDVWLGDQATCEAYGQRSFTAAAEALNVRNGTVETRFPPGDACLLIENGPFAKGRANATGPVTVRYVIELWEE